MDVFCPFRQRLKDKSKKHSSSHTEQLSPVFFIHERSSEGGPPRATRGAAAAPDALPERGVEHPSVLQGSLWEKPGWDGGTGAR